jgi:hypothetical protein
VRPTAQCAFWVYQALPIMVAFPCTFATDLVALALKGLVAYCLRAVRDHRNPARMRVMCRDETELHQVKEVANKLAIPGIRVLRDQLYLVKVDGTSQSAILNSDGAVQDGIHEALSKEYGVEVRKLAWLSDKNNGKAYGSMVVYFTRSTDVGLLLQGQYSLARTPSSIA